MDSSAPQQQGYRIVVVEDDNNLALLLRYNLEARAHDVRWFADGTAAWIGLCVEPPDAVILDWGLPGLAGIEILRRMRMCESLRAVPVLMLTGRCHPEDRQRALQTGANAFLAKPFSIREVIDALHQMTARSESEHLSELAGAL